MSVRLGMFWALWSGDPFRFVNQFLCDATIFLLNNVAKFSFETAYLLKLMLFLNPITTCREHPLYVSTWLFCGSVVDINRIPFSLGSYVAVIVVWAPRWQTHHSWHRSAAVHTGLLRLPRGVSKLVSSTGELSFSCFSTDGCIFRPKMTHKN